MLDRLIVLVGVLALALAIGLAGRWLARRWGRGTAGLPPSVAERLAIPAGKPAVVYFFTPLCGACQDQRTALDELRQAAAVPFTLLALDARRHADLAASLGVMTVPTTVVLDAGRRIRSVHHRYVPVAVLRRDLVPAAATS